MPTLLAARDKPTENHASQREEVERTGSIEGRNRMARDGTYGFEALQGHE